MSFKKNHTNRVVDRITTIDGIQYKLNRIVEATATDIHHIMGKCNKKNYNTDIDENKIRINRREHIALNNFFKEKQNPREQLLKVFNIVKPVLSPGVRQELDIILNMTDDELFYIPELLKNGRNKKKRMERGKGCVQKLNTDERKL